MLSERLIQMQEYREFLPKLEELYFDIAYDIGLANQELKDSLSVIQAMKTKLKKDSKSIAEFNREYELTQEFIIYKSHKYEIKGLEKMMAGIRVRVESLRAEAKGIY